MTPSLGQMLVRVFKAEGQSRSARTVELFGWYDLTLGLLILLFPLQVAGVLDLPTLSWQAANYVRLVGLLVGGLGMLYVVSGRLSAQGFIFASLVDRPMVPVIMGVLWYLDILPGALAVAFSVSDFGGFLWTLQAWCAERPSEGAVAGAFGFVSGVVRNSRTFHPDGRAFLGTVDSLHPSDAGLARAAEHLAGSSVLLRIGMGLMKKGMPPWLVKLVPDAPSVAARFFSPQVAGEVRMWAEAGNDLDLLCTAGGDRLWKLILNLTTGGRSFGLQPRNYFSNVYYAQVPYRIDGGQQDVWLRFVPEPQESLDREEGLDQSSSAARDATNRSTTGGHRQRAFCSVRGDPVRGRDRSRPGGTALRSGRGPGF